MAAKTYKELAKDKKTPKKVLDACIEEALDILKRELPQGITKQDILDILGDAHETAVRIMISSESADRVLVVGKIARIKYSKRHLAELKKKEELADQLRKEKKRIQRRKDYLREKERKLTQNKKEEQ